LAVDLIARARKVSLDGEQGDGEDTHSIPFDLRKAKETQVVKLLERQYVKLRRPAWMFVLLTTLLDLRSLKRSIYS